MTGQVGTEPDFPHVLVFDGDPGQQPGMLYLGTSQHSHLEEIPDFLRMGLDLMKSV